MGALTSPAGATTVDDLLEHCGDLKRALVEFAQHNRFGRAYRQLLRDEVEDATEVDEFYLVNLLDQFALQHRLHDGQTVVEKFVASHRKLTDDDRRILLGWRDVVLGLFEVKHHDDGALVTLNLVDDLSYRIYSNMGWDFLDVVPDGAFLLARIVPLGDDWLISGMNSILPAHERAAVYKAAADIALKSPVAVFRNPEKVEQGWARQRAEHEIFIAHFGADLVVLPGFAATERIQAYWHYRLHDALDSDGMSSADRAKGEYGAVHRQPAFGVPDFSDVDTVAVVYDEVDGLMFWSNFGTLVEVFDEPELAAVEPYRSAVIGYLTEESVKPVALRRLAERDTAAVSRVFQTVLGRPDFDWARDGEALLREYKSGWLDRPARPCVTVLSDVLAEALLDVKDSAAA